MMWMWSASARPDENGQKRKTYSLMPKLSLTTVGGFRTYMPESVLCRRDDRPLFVRTSGVPSSAAMSRSFDIFSLVSAEIARW